jgi:PAS domain S-box-containing protein
MHPLSRLTAVPSRPLAVLPAVVSVAAAIPTLRHFASSQDSLLASALSAAVLLFFCLPLFLGSWWLLGNSFTRAERRRVVVWMLAGALPITLLAGVVILYELSHGVAVAHPLIVSSWVAGVGSIGGFLTGVHDMRSARRNDRLEETSQRLRALIEASPVAIVTIDHEGTVLDWSQAAEEMFGWEREAVVGERYPIVPDERETEFADHLDRVNGGEVLDGVETQRTHRDGRRVDVQVWSAPIEHDGEVAEHVVALTDIGERKERQREVNLLRRAIEQADDAVLITNDDGVIEYVNDAFVDLFGYSREAVLGHTPRILKSGEHADRFYDRLWDTITDGDVFQAEVTNRCATGERCQVELTIAPVETSGTVTHYVAIERDITERKRTQQRLEVLNRVLRHDVRNAVGVLQGNATRLREEFDDGESRLALDRIAARADDLHSSVEKARTVERALDTTRTDPIHVRTLVESQRESFEDDHPDGRLAVDVPGTLWVEGNHTLEAALREALDNAFEHADSEAPTVRVVATARGDDRVDVCIIDDGPGVPPHERRVIDNGEESALQHGSGLGLWLMKWVVTSLGGDIDIGERAVGGTVLTFTLPAATSPPDHEPERQAPE